jgi:hypothetical protein
MVGLPSTFLLMIRSISHFSNNKQQPNECLMNSTMWDATILARKNNPYAVNRTKIKTVQAVVRLCCFPISRCHGTQQDASSRLEQQFQF